jgi:hypothetical protein
MADEKPPVVQPDHKECNHNYPGREFGQPCPICNVQPTAQEWQGDANTRKKNA